MLSNLIKTGAMAPICKTRNHMRLSQMLASPNASSHAISQTPTQARGFSYKPKRGNSPGRSPSSKTSASRGKIDVEELKGSRKSVFAHESTFTLCKKLLIYRLMGSNLFINYSLFSINTSYRLLGLRLTNAIIDSTAGSIFVGGVTVDELNRTADALKGRNIGTLVGYVVEGLRDKTNSELDEYVDFCVNSINSITEGGKEGNF